MRTLIVLPLLAGCLSEETRLVESWVGVYEAKSYRLDAETCSEDAPEAESPAPFYAIDAVVWEELTALALRHCDAADVCDQAPWFDIVVDEIDENRIVGTGGVYEFMPVSADLAYCAIQGVRMVLTRADEDELDVEVWSYVIEEAVVLEEEDCVEILQDMPDEECVAYHAIESARVR